MGHLLLGSPRTHRATSEQDNQSGQAFPGGEIYLSFPGPGDRSPPRVAGEIGEHTEQFDSPNALACYDGKAPVTRRSGKSEYVVASRLACNRYLRDATVRQWAFCPLHRAGWARQFYDRHIADHHSHHAALRASGNRRLEVLWHCLTRGVRYNEAIHTANRNAPMARPRAA